MRREINSNLLKEKRSQLNWTQEELAENARLSVRTVQRAELHGKTSPRTLRALANALQIESTHIIQSATKDEESTELAQATIKPINTSLIFSQVKEARLKEEQLKTGSKQHVLIAGSLLTLGGYLSVAVMLMVVANLSREAILNVLLPGVSIGSALMLVGGALYCYTNSPSRRPLRKIFRVRLSRKS